ncbi:hypothetical protein PV10_05276 [Exophiala mesophila]|uniref:Copper transport protein n=1 Tax=Exophiala mesophila TaxID=212818 RepID=A0A0D2A551_EXOME|nr:uncharacterized protein PV10_05276 [Exophiala mesophila]KIV94128.1 hypothetical protein PV10_05276 [Exophiala mesophila]
MEGMSMAMISTSGTATPTATVLATAAGLTSTIPEALQSDIMPPTDMQMQGMSSFIHFGLGDPFFARLLTPTHASGYVAVMLFLMMLSFGQRLLMVVETKAAQNLHHARPADDEGQVSKSGSWVEIAEDVQPSGRFMSRFIVRALLKSGLKVLDAALGFLVMLAVMTLNAGYMIALLVGIFLGEFLSSWAHRNGTS